MNLDLELPGIYNSQSTGVKAGAEGRKMERKIMCGFNGKCKADPARSRQGRGKRNGRPPRSDSSSILPGGIKIIMILMEKVSTCNIR